MRSAALTSAVLLFSSANSLLSLENMAATTLVSTRLSLRKIFLPLYLLSTLVSAQNAPPYGSGTAATCPGATDGAQVNVGGIEYTIYCNSDIGNTLTTVPATSVIQAIRGTQRRANVLGTVRWMSRIL